VSGQLFILRSGALTVGDNSKLTAPNTNNSALITINSNSTFTMTGTSSITGHTTSSQLGAVQHSGGTFIMNGGEITGNSTTSDAADATGGVYFGSGTFTVGGSARVYGNTRGTSAERGNVYLATSANNAISFGTGDNEPAPGMEIWLRRYDVGQFATISRDQTYYNNNLAYFDNWFRMDETDKALFYAWGGSLYLSILNATVIVKQNDVVVSHYTNLSNAVTWINNNKGDYTVTLLQNMSFPGGNLQLNAEGTIILTDDTEKTITAVTYTSSGITINSGTTLILNNVKLLGAANNTYPLVNIDNGAVLTMSGSSAVTGNSETAGDVFVSFGSSLKMSGNATIGMLTLSTSTALNSSVEFTGAWNGNIETLNLHGTQINIEDATTINVVSRWLANSTVLRGTGLTDAIASSINGKLGVFINNDGSDTRAISPTHGIITSGADRGKLQAKQGITFTIPPFGAGQPVVSSGVTISRTSAGGNSNYATFTIPNADNYSSIVWYFENTELNDSATATKQAALTVTVGGTPAKPYDILGTQRITAEVFTTGGQFYTVDVTFTVVP
jgi:hypothetical protein